jgi:hypothetical protein
MKASGSIPMMHNTGQSVIVRHREYITDILSSESFAVQKKFYLNPGLEASFPWLAAIAQNFQEYSWKGLVFEYVPTSGASVASTNTALGSVMVSTNYRATASDYTSKQAMLNDYFATDARPTEPFAHPIECDPRENPYNVQYVRTGAVPSGEDQKTYDIGVTTVATIGNPAAGNNLGELWVSYEVELRKPKLLSTGLPQALWYKEDRTGFTTATANFGATGGTPVGDDFRVTGTTITWPAQATGSYDVIMTYAVTSITGLASMVLNATNCTVPLLLSPVGATITSSGGYYHFYAQVSVPDANKTASVTTTTNIIAGTVATVTIRVLEVNSIAI